MAYVSYEYYTNLYEKPEIDQKTFERVLWNAEKKLDMHTSGVDGVRKLKIAFPVVEEDAEAVKRCVIELVELMHKIETAERNAEMSKGYVEREDVSMHGKVISSLSAGNETINFATGNNVAMTLMDNLVLDKSAQERLFEFTINEYLSGVLDANGVNLLYMGRYPYGVR